MAESILEPYKKRRNENRQELGEAPNELKELAKSVIDRARDYADRNDQKLLNGLPANAVGGPSVSVPYHPYDAAAEILSDAFCNLETKMRNPCFRNAIPPKEKLEANKRWSVEETEKSAKAKRDLSSCVIERPSYDEIASEYAKTILHAEISCEIDKLFEEESSPRSIVAECYNTLTKCRTKLEKDREYSLGNGMSKHFLEFSGKKLGAVYKKVGKKKQEEKLTITAVADRETWSGYALILQLSLLLFLHESKLGENAFWRTEDFEFFRAMVNLDRIKASGRSDARTTAKKLQEETKAFCEQTNKPERRLGDALFLPGAEPTRYVRADEGQWPMVFREPLAMALKFAEIEKEDPDIDLPSMCVNILEMAGIWKSNPSEKENAEKKLRENELQLYALAACWGTGRFPARAADGYLERVFGRDAVINPQTGDVLFSRSNAASREFPHAILFGAQSRRGAAPSGLIANPGHGNILGIYGIFGDGGISVVSSFDPKTPASVEYPKDSIFAYKGQFHLAGSTEGREMCEGCAKMTMDEDVVDAHLYNRRIEVCGKGLPGMPGFWTTKGISSAGKAFAFNWDKKKNEGTLYTFLTVLPLANATDAPFHTIEDAPSIYPDEEEAAQRHDAADPAPDMFPIRTGEISGNTIVSIESNCASRSEFTVERTIDNAIQIRKSGGAHDADVFVLLQGEIHHNSLSNPLTNCTIWTFSAKNKEGNLQPCPASMAEPVDEKGAKIEACSSFGVLVWRSDNGLGAKSSVFLFEREAEAERILAEYGEIFDENRKDNTKYNDAVRKEKDENYAWLAWQTDNTKAKCENGYKRYAAAQEESGLAEKDLDLLVFSVSWLTYVGN